MAQYHLITVGGGLAGASLAKVMAESGARVLVLEQETRFRDRLRGEALLPWGVAEARTLGLEAPLLASGAVAVPGHTLYDGPQPRRRDLPATTPHGAGLLDYYHPMMQETLIDLARNFGAEVRRGAVVMGIIPGVPPRVAFRQNGSTEELTARLVVGADGRESKVRGWAGFAVRRDAPHTLVAGVLFDGLPAAQDTSHIFRPPTFGETALMFPQGGARVRVYLATARRTERGRLSGASRLGDFVRACVECGVPADWFAAATACGPLASHEGAPRWVEHPYRDGVALVGDAAAASDPAYGNGQALTLRDVRVLADALRGGADWDAAAHQYASEHDRYFEALHTIEGWMTRINYTLGPEADRIRERALPVLRQGLGPDLFGVGPETPADEAMRLRLFGA